MITGYTHMHSALRWVILITLIFAVLKHFLGKKDGRNYSPLDKRMALIPLILAHIQLLVGLVLYFGKGYNKFVENTMTNAVSRFWAVEHIGGMILAVILITIGFSKAKKIADNKKRFSKIFVFYLIALILMLVSIPWPFRAGFEHLGWF